MLFRKRTSSRLGAGLLGGTLTARMRPQLHHAFVILNERRNVRYPRSRHVDPSRIPAHDIESALEDVTEQRSFTEESRVPRTSWSLWGMYYESSQVNIGHRLVESAHPRIGEQKSKAICARHRRWKHPHSDDSLVLGGRGVVIKRNGEEATVERRVIRACGPLDCRVFSNENRAWSGGYSRQTQESIEDRASIPKRRQK
ncbi:hypothetical protein B0H14DRAFT_363771 [Mycena olivaceomarginata]|nr:hypothetical protein B0H14DRAFT_363771 [Mycena olivaceomarginata]